MLEKFRKAKEREIAELLELERAGSFPKPLKGKRPDFAAALRSRPFSIIAEYKRSSPSKGVIREDLAIEEVAREYGMAGASAISVLTETDWFGGDFNYLDRAVNASKLPVLRKDFIFHPVQIRHTAVSKAAAVLLIARCTPDAKLLKELREEAANHGLACVVEVFNMDDLELARASGASIIQVNSRDLDKLSVNRRAALDLAVSGKPKESEIWIAASGVASPQDLVEARNAGFKSALIGTSLMQAPSPGEKLEALLEGLTNAD